MLLALVAIGGLAGISGAGACLLTWRVLTGFCGHFHRRVAVPACCCRLLMMLAALALFLALAVVFSSGKIPVPLCCGPVPSGAMVTL